jgi:SAM-dependent methyltransferase
MHPEAYNYVKQFAEGRQFGRVLEFGSLDINGSVRDLFRTDTYLGVDLQGGPGVDIVADAMFFDHPIKFDVVVCCEVLEHAKYWDRIIQSAHRNLNLGGWFIVTCATDPREPHSARDGGALRPGEFYMNVSDHLLDHYLSQSGFIQHNKELHRDRGDLYALAQKP